MKLQDSNLYFLVAALLLLVGCGGVSESDIEATVEARVAEEKAAEATFEARVTAAAAATVSAAPNATVTAPAVATVSRRLLWGL